MFVMLESMSPWVEPSTCTRRTTRHLLFILLCELGFKKSRAIFNPYLIIWADTNSFYTEMKSYFPGKFSQGIMTTKGHLVLENLLMNAAGFMDPEV